MAMILARCSREAEWNEGVGYDKVMITDKIAMVDSSAVRRDENSRMKP